MTNPPPVSEPPVLNPAAILAMVQQYGLATVLCVVLVCYLLWSAYSTQNQLVPAIMRLEQAQSETLVLIRQQQELLRYLSDVRLQCVQSSRVP